MNLLACLRSQSENKRSSMRKSVISSTSLRPQRLKVPQPPQEPPWNKRKRSRRSKLRVKQSSRKMRRSSKKWPSNLKIWRHLQAIKQMSWQNSQHRSKVYRKRTLYYRGRLRNSVKLQVRPNPSKKNSCWSNHSWRNALLSSIRSALSTKRNRQSVKSFWTSLKISRVRSGYTAVFDRSPSERKKTLRRESSAILRQMKCHWQ